MIRRLALFASLTASLAALPLAGCGSDGSDDGLDPDGTYNCEIEDRDDTFIAGMAKQGAGGIEVTLVTATPTPPARGDNTWTVELKQNGTPVSGAAVEVIPFMPDHRHGTPVTPTVTATANPGEYQVTPVNLWMPGLWEITVKATPSGGTQDTVVFRFCITG
jgi:hypothetical protein